MYVLPDPPLQPLRIPAGWQVSYNQFFDVEPRSDIDPDSDAWVYFKEDMLQVTHARWCVLIDLGWYPEHQPDGGFRLVLIQLTDTGDEMTSAWSHPLATYWSPSRHMIVTTIEA